MTLYRLHFLSLAAADCLWQRNLINVSILNHSSQLELQFKNALVFVCVCVFATETNETIRCKQISSIQSQVRQN